MAKHSGELVADIDDGYMKVAFVLFEALFCMPLTKAELRVAGFIMRRTYGWAKNGDRDSGKMDVITSKTIAKGTQLGLSNVKKSIVSLTKNNVIFAEKMPASNSMAYGINPVIKEWGNNDKEWEIAKKQLIDAKSDGCFVNSGEYKKTDSIEAQKNEEGITPIVSEGITPIVTPEERYNTYSDHKVTRIVTQGNTYSDHKVTRIVCDAHPVSPYTPRPGGVPTESLTESLTESITDNDVKDSAHLFSAEEKSSSESQANAPQRLLFNGETPTPKTAAKKQRKSDDDWITPKDATDENKAQQTIRFAFTELLKKDYRYKRKGFSALIETVNTYGADIIHEWVDTIGRLVIPEGADEWKYFTMSFNNAARRPFEWRNKKPTDIYIPHKTPKTNEWGEVIPE